MTTLITILAITAIIAAILLAWHNRKLSKELKKYEYPMAGYEWMQVPVTSYRSSNPGQPVWWWKGRLKNEVCKDMQKGAERLQKEAKKRRVL